MCVCVHACVRACLVLILQKRQPPIIACKGYTMDCTPKTYFSLTRKTLKKRPPPTIGSLVETVNAQTRVLLLDLSRLDLRQGLDGGVATVLCQRQWNSFQSLGKCPHRVLLQCGDLRTQGGMRSVREVLSQSGRCSQGGARLGRWAVREVGSQGGGQSGRWTVREADSQGGAVREVHSQGGARSATVSLCSG